VSFYPFAAPGFTLRSQTTVAGFTLVNATPTIITWAVPNDGLLHGYQIFAQQSVTVNEVGGELAIVFTSVDGNVESQQLSAAGLTAGVYGPGSFSWLSGLAKAGTTITLEQFTALTGGAATFWAQIWGT